MDSLRLQKNLKLESKINSLNTRLSKLESLLNRGSSRLFKKKAITLYRIQKILFKRYIQINNSNLEQMTTSPRSTSKVNFDQVLSNLEQDNLTLIGAIDSAKIQATGIENSGIFGQVSLISGNCMPSTDSNSSCKENTLNTKVIIRPLSQVSSSYVYYDFKEEPLAQVVSDQQGLYALNLEPGVYSIFVEDQGREYCNSFDSEGHACRIELNADSKIEYDISVDHAFW